MTTIRQPFVKTRTPLGFTLMEVLVSVAIVSTLALVAVPLSEITVQRTKEAELRRALREIRDAIDAYKLASDEGRILRSPEQSGYPPSLTALVEGIPDTITSTKRYFMRRIPHDPFYPESDTSPPPERTWGLRSYQSPLQDPKPGKDVFDIYSLSRRTGLNGIPLREW
jgi:general secretion pathway protein G